MFVFTHRPKIAARQKSVTRTAPCFGGRGSLLDQRGWVLTPRMPLNQTLVGMGHTSISQSLKKQQKSQISPNCRSPCGEHQSGLKNRGTHNGGFGLFCHFTSAEAETRAHERFLTWCTGQKKTKIGTANDAGSHHGESPRDQVKRWAPKLGFKKGEKLRMRAILKYTQKLKRNHGAGWTPQRKISKRRFEGAC